MTDRQKFKIHACGLDPECRGFGAPRGRVHLNTPWFHLGVSLTPSSRFVNREGRERWVSVRRWR